MNPKYLQSKHNCIFGKDVDANIPLIYIRLIKYTTDNKMALWIKAIIGKKSDASPKKNMN